MSPADPHRLRRTIALVALVAAFVPGPAAAQGVVEAEILFREGRRLLDAGRLAEACDAFDASRRIEPSVGVLLNAADCRERNRQLATAWALFLEAAALARRQDGDARREAEAQRRAELLTPRLSYLTVSVPDSSKVEGLVVRRDGQDLDPALWNQGIPVDAGEYEIEAGAPGHQPWSVRVAVGGEGTRAVAEVPRFKRIAGLVDPFPATASPPVRRHAEVATLPPPPAPPGRFTTTRKLGVGVAALGVAALAGGALSMVRAGQWQRHADALCPQAACDDPDAIAHNDRARRSALYANVLFSTGGAAIAGAAILWWLGAPDAPAPRRDRVSARPVVTPTSFGVALSGGF